MKTRIAYKLLAAIVLLALTSVQPHPAWACECLPPGPPSVEFADSGAVFAGVATSVLSLGTGGSIVSFRVYHSWKGVTTPSVTLWTPYSGGTCGYDFSRDSQYIVYAREWRGMLATNICSRTGPIPADLPRLGNDEDSEYLRTLPTLDLTPRLFHKYSRTRVFISMLWLPFSCMAGIVLGAIALVLVIRQIRRRARRARAET